MQIRHIVEVENEEFSIHIITKLYIVMDFFCIKQQK